MNQNKTKQLTSISRVAPLSVTSHSVEWIIPSPYYFVFLALSNMFLSLIQPTLFGSKPLLSTFQTILTTFFSIYKVCPNAFYGNVKRRLLESICFQVACSSIFNSLVINNDSNLMNYFQTFQQFEYFPFILPIQLLWIESDFTTLYHSKEREESCEIKLQNEQYSAKL